MPGLVGESGGFGFVRLDVLRFGPSILEGGITGHVGHQMLAGGLELIADQAEMEQEDPEVVLGGNRRIRKKSYAKLTVFS